jgi:predicted  nucleic acid-binding Zn-ribbon protein
MTETTTTSPTIEELETQAEEITQEIETLESQLRDARTQIARAQARFAELNEERTRLAPKTFGGDSKARLALEAQHDETARDMRVAEAAEPELARMATEAKERLRQANRAVLEAERSALAKEMSALDPERDALADQLAEVLGRQSALYGAMTDKVREYDQDQANAMTLRHGAVPRNYLRRKFRRWLG